MAGIVAAGADVVWHTSDNTRLEDPETIMDDGAQGIPEALRHDPLRYHRITDRALAVAAAVADCRPGDLLLLAGKGHEPYQDVMGVKHPVQRPRRGGGGPPGAGAVPAPGRWRRDDGLDPREAREAVGGTLQGDGGVAPAALSMDTRTLRPGDGFVAIRGQRDAHDFASEAVAKGAVALLVDHGLPLDVPQLIVPDTLAALQRWGQARLAAFRPRVVLAVTGSVGKTSTKELLAARHRRLEDPGQPQQRLRPARSPGHPARGPGRVGAGDGHEHPGEIAPAHRDRPAGPRPRHQHRQRAHGVSSPTASRASRAPRASWWRPCAPGGLWVHLADDPWCRWVALQPWARARAVPVGPGAAFGWEDERSRGLHGEAFNLRHPGGSVPVRLRLRGAHHVRNAALAGALAILAGFAPEAVAAGPGRGGTRCPAAAGCTPCAGAAGSWTKATTPSRNPSSHARRPCRPWRVARVAVLGCMRELGPAAASLHRETGEGLKRLGIDRVLVYGDDARVLAEGFGPGASAYPGFEAMRDDPAGLGADPPRGADPGQGQPVPGTPPGPWRGCSTTWGPAPRGRGTETSWCR